MTIEAFAMHMLHAFVFCVAPLHLTSACDAQFSNEVTSVEGAFFPAGLSKLHLVGLNCCRL